MTRNDPSILILPSLLGAPNAKGEIQCCAYLQPVHTKHGFGLSLIIGQQGEHTKDAVYIDSERRFQELEKVCPL